MSFICSFAVYKWLWRRRYAQDRMSRHVVELMHLLVNYINFNELLTPFGRRSSPKNSFKIWQNRRFITWLLVFMVSMRKKVIKSRFWHNYSLKTVLLGNRVYHVQLPDFYSIIILIGGGNCVYIEVKREKIPLNDWLKSNSTAKSYQFLNGKQFYGFIIP